MACSSSEEQPLGPGWQEAFDAENRGWLLSAWGSASDDIYAVGAKGAELRGLVMHYDGSEWRELDLGFDAPMFQWVHGRSATDVTFVGADGVIVHYNGDEAVRQDSPTNLPLWGVWGARSDDLWAVGGSALGVEPALLRYDGDEWGLVAYPSLEDDAVRSFFKVWGAADDDVWIVGGRGTVLHYDGEEFTERSVDTEEDWIAVWGGDSERVVFVGGRTRGVIGVLDGGEVQLLEDLPRDIGGLNGVWLSDSGPAYAVGTEGTNVSIDLNGDIDGDSVEVLTPPTDECLHGVFGIDGALYSVGGNLVPPLPPPVGVAFVRGI